MKRTHPSICRFCHASCPILVEVEGGRAVRVRADRENPIYHGYTCPKGNALPEQHNHPDRLLHSVKRTDTGSHVPIPSKQAIAEIARVVEETVDRHGPRAVALYQGTFSLFYPASIPFAHAFMNAIGSPMRFTPSTIDQPGKPIATALHGAWGGGPQPFVGADVWMLVGVNPTVSKSIGAPPNNPAWHLHDAIRKGLQLIVIDPRRSEVAKQATVHLQAKPGEDPTILAGLLRIIIAEDLHDADFVRENARGFDRLRARVEPFTPEYVARRADVPVADLIRAARIFAGGCQGMANAGTGPNMAGRGNLVEYLLLCLNTLCGRWLREGQSIPNPGVLMPPVKAKAQPLAPMAAWGFGERLRVRGLSDTVAGLPTAALADEILLDGEGQIRVLFCLGGNPMAAWPDQARTHRALQSLDLLVTLDIKMSATAKLADYVIASKLTLEQPGMSLLLESFNRYAAGYQVPYGQYTPAIVDVPPGSDLLEEWEFFYEMARTMGKPLAIQAPSAWGPDADQPARIEIDMGSKPSTEALLEMLTLDSHVPLSEVRKYRHGRVFTNLVTRVAPRESECNDWLELADETMMAELEEVADESLASDSKWPFRLICRRLLDVHNSAGRDLGKSARKQGFNPAFIHPDDLQALRIQPGDLIEIRSCHGAIRAIAEAENCLRRGIVSMTHGYGDAPTLENDLRVREIGSNTGRLIDSGVDYDPYSGIPRMSAIPVAISRIVN